MLNQLPPNLKNQNPLTKVSSLFSNFQYKTLLQKETNLLKKLPDVDEKIEEKVSNFIIVFSIFLTTFTVALGFLTSSFNEENLKNDYNLAVAKNFLFLNASSLENIKKEVEYLNEYNQALERTKESDSRILTNIISIRDEFEKGSTVNNILINRKNDGYEYRFIVIPEGRDFQTFIDSIKTYYPELSDISYEEDSSDIGEIVVKGTIR